MLELLVLPITKNASHVAPEAGSATATEIFAREFEVVYHQTDTEELMDILFFMTDWAKEWKLKASELPKVFFREKATLFSQYERTIRQVIECDDPLEVTKVRFTYRNSPRPLLLAYLSHLERKVYEANLVADEDFLVDTKHPLFSPPGNAVLNSELVKAEILRDFFRSLISQHFPERQRMN